MHQILKHKDILFGSVKSIKRKLTDKLRFSYCSILRLEFIREGKGMEWHDHKGMERNRMEWNIFK